MNAECVRLSVLSWRNLLLGELLNSCYTLFLNMTIKTKSMMRRRVNRARPSGLVYP
jgi:hypothetical protein